jgi:hypothetical protein
MAKLARPLQQQVMGYHQRLRVALLLESIAHCRVEVLPRQIIHLVHEGYPSLQKSHTGHPLAMGWRA